MDVVGNLEMRVRDMAAAKKALEVPAPVWWPRIPERPGEGRDSTGHRSDDEDGS